jgi:hypothetical protein
MRNVSLTEAFTESIFLGVRNEYGVDAGWAVSKL